ncbi:TIGR03089 family protein [Cellulosimicrobium sp. NPDC057862]|uniref:TIGR03089 family protein n=1 Tax=Cellulosimicrobium sp. NPDC057862 TaxID=3346266 RepID=UPI00366B2D0E
MVTAPHPPAPRDDRPRHVADLLRLVTRDPGRPRLTWYGDDHERVELSGAVLENWVNKTTNLLVEEFDAGPGTRVVLDLPAHWRTVVWALAIWRTGATVVLAPAEDDATTGAVGTRADVVVTTRPDRWAGTRAELVAVALPALARRFGADLPAGAIDAASAVMTYGDQLGWVPDVDPEAAALEDGPSTTTHRAVFATTVATGGAREVVDGRLGVPGSLARLLTLWSADGSAVLLAPDVATGLDADPDRRARLLQSERAS